MSRFDQTRVVVTGAGSGFGEAIAKRFATEGARVVVSDIQAENGARVAADIEAAGGTASFVPADVSSEADVEGLVAAACEAYGGIDVLVNNAGFSHRQKLTWKLCHLYYNQPGTVRSPAPLVYADRLAAMVGQVIQSEPHPELREKLFYL